MTAETPPILAEVGATGLKRSSGFLTEEFLPQLSGSRGVRVYREMADNEAVIGGALLAMETLVKQVLWTVEPANDTPEAHRVAEFVDSCREDMEHTWSDFLSEAMSMTVFGWAWFEEVYKIRRGPSESSARFRSKHSDGLWGWRKFGVRAQESLYEWKFDDETGDVLGMWQMPAPSYRLRFLPLEKSLHFRIRSRKGSPEGRSLLRNAYRSWYFLKRIQEIEAIGVERDLAGLPDMQVPVEVMNAAPGSQLAQLRAYYETMVSRIRRGEYEGIVRPTETLPNGNSSGYKFGLVASGGRRPVDVDAIIKRYESRILISLLAEFLVLGMDKVGSFALSSDKTDLFAQSIRAILSIVVDGFNRTAIPRLCSLNGIPVEMHPKLKHGDIEKRSLTEIATYIGTLTGSGHLAPSDALDDWLREQGDLPAREKGEERPAIEAATADLASVLPFDKTGMRAYGVREPSSVTKARDSFTPPKSVQAAARRGLELREKWSRGGLSTQQAGEQRIGSGVARATTLANGDGVSEDTARAMAAFFARHEKNRGGPDAKADDGGPTAGWIAWLLWGGDEGRAWAEHVVEQLEAEEAA